MAATAAASVLGWIFLICFTCIAPKVSGYQMPSEARHFFAGDSAAFGFAVTTAVLGGLLWVACLGLAFKEVATRAKTGIVAAHAVLFVFSLICWVSLVPKTVYSVTLSPDFTAGHGTLVLTNILYLAATVLASIVSVDDEVNATLTEVTVGSNAVVGAPASESPAKTQ